MGSAGRKLLAQAYVDNSGTINARTSQSGSNVAVGSNNVNQANNNQNAQAAGNGASAANNAAIKQSNGRATEWDILQLAMPLRPMQH